MPKRGHPGGTYSPAKRARKAAYRSRKKVLSKRFAYARKGFAKAVKSVILKTSETMYKTRKQTTSTCLHNNLYHIMDMDSGSTLWPSQGDGDGNRKGDEIYATGIMIRAAVNLPFDRKATRLRFFLVEYDWNQTGSPEVYENFFHNISSNGLLDTIQTKRFKVRAAWTQQWNGPDNVAEATATEAVVLVKKWIPLKRRICFQSDTSTVVTKGLSESFRLMMLPYDTINTSKVLDNVVNGVECCATLYYKDP